VLGGRGHTGSRAKPALTTVITVPPGQAASRSVTVKLPKGVGVDFQRLASRCTTAQAEANACPTAARVGTATARTALLPVPLSGPVYLSDIAGQPLPGLLVAFDTPVSLKLGGTVAFPMQKLQSTFGTVPDVPLERFELALVGGRTGALTLGVGADLCKGAPPTIAGEFIAHSGATASDRRPVVIAGCGPRATIALRRLSSRRPRLDLTVRRDPDGPALRGVRLQLPRRLVAKARRAGHGGLTAQGGGRRLAGSLTRRGILAVRAPKGADTITVSLRNGAFRPSRRLGNHPTLTFRLQVTDAKGSRTNSTLKVKK
jgi:hypothetical protein